LNWILVILAVAYLQKSVSPIDNRKYISQLETLTVFRTLHAGSRLASHAPPSYLPFFEPKLDSYPTPHKTAPPPSFIEQPITTTTTTTLGRDPYVQVISIDANRYHHHWPTD